MGWLDRFLSMIGFEVEMAEDEMAASEEPAAREELPRQRRRARPNPASSPVVALPSKADAGGHVVLFTPRTFDDVQVVADHLKARRPVLLNLEGVDRDLAQRVTNFLSGTIYALSGEMHPVTPNVLFFAPGGVFVSVEGRPPTRSPRGTPGPLKE